MWFAMLSGHLVANQDPGMDSGVASSGVVVIFTCDGVDDGAQDGRRFNQLFQDVGLGGQGEAVIQHLLQQLVHHHHVVFDGRLSAHAKIVLMGHSLLLLQYYYLLPLVITLLKINM